MGPAGFGAPALGETRLTRYLELVRRWATWPLAVAGLLAWFALLYFMVGDLL
jgi:hypothetical protein